MRLHFNSTPVVGQRVKPAFAFRLDPNRWTPIDCKCQAYGLECRSIAAAPGRRAAVSRREDRRQVLLQNLARAVSGVAGESFFRSLVRNLATELSADYCFIGEIHPDDACEARPLAFRASGAIAPNFDYQLDDSPCANVVSRHGSIAVLKVAAKQYPADLGPQRMAVEGYLGVMFQ